MSARKPRPVKTNEAVLLSLKGEKLAVFLDRNNFCPDSPLECERMRCGECILQWLKEAAEGC